MRDNFNRKHNVFFPPFLNNDARSNKKKKIRQFTRYRRVGSAADFSPPTAAIPVYDAVTYKRRCQTRINRLLHGRRPPRKNTRRLVRGYYYFFFLPSNFNVLFSSESKTKKKKKSDLCYGFLIKT